TTNRSPPVRRQATRRSGRYPPPPRKASILSRSESSQQVGPGCTAGTMAPAHSLSSSGLNPHEGDGLGGNDQVQPPRPGFNQSLVLQVGRGGVETVDLSHCRAHAAELNGGRQRNIRT